MQVNEFASSTANTVSDQTLILYLDIFILLVILFFSLLNIPRALVYIANSGSELLHDCLLRSSTEYRLRPPTTLTTKESMEKVLPESSLPILESAAPHKQPWHLPMHFSLRHPAASFLRYHVLDNYTVLQVILMVGYTVAVFLTAFYESDPFTNPSRIGWVIASQFPFAYAFATKNNVIGLLVGVGYEKLNYLHRHVGRLMVIAANVHTIGYIYKWCLAGNISAKIAQPYVQWGIVALVCFDLLGFFSMQWVRTKSYNLFIGTHVVGLIVVLIGACLHQQVCIPFVIAGSAVYGLDHIIRAIKTRFATATVRTIPEFGLTRVDIPSLGTGWRPGQHVRVRILSAAMGLWRTTEVHPFTIASATNTEHGLVLMCKKTGNWTRKLYEIAQTTESGEQGQQHGTKVSVIVEGPYGGVCGTTIPNYSGAMFVVGGSGVTFAMSAVQDLVLSCDRSRIKVIDVIWSITDPSALETFISLFSELVSGGSSTTLRISVFYTRSTSSALEELSLPHGITLAAGRPKIDKLLDEFVARMVSQGDLHGAFVGVCGPVMLARDVSRAVRVLNNNSKKAIGGIQFHEEVFGW